LAVAVARRGVRLGVELAAAAVALVVWGRPIATAPVDDPLVPAVPPPAGSPDVILIVLDTTRADHLSTYGYARETARHLSAFAADGLLFTQARSPAAWTLPGHASLFTGTYPTRHGAHFAGARLGGRSREGRPAGALPPPPAGVTLVEPPGARGLPGAGRLARSSLYYEHAVTHLPEVERQFIEANYDGEVAAMDEALGELLDALRARGRYQNALVVVTSDHGEFLGEHEQMGHIGQMLYEPVLHVPLVVKFPGTDGPRGRSETAVQLVDVLPTVLAATGAAVPPGLQGEALPHVTHPSFAEEDIDPFLVARCAEAAGARPRLSVVMPVYNAEATLAECLTRLSRSSFGDFEIVLVDDGSTDQSRAIAAGFPLRVVPTAGRIGPAAARNLGAQAAEGELLFFLDADVMVRPDTLSRIVAAFERDEIEGVIGVQAAEMRHRDLVSQYKNLWMRWTYCRRRGDVPLFYTTAAAIRRDAFLRAGGFDQGYATPNVEDTAFGQKLARLGIRVCIDPGLEVEHVRRYSLAG